jgi:hypothetical protein
MSRLNFLYRRPAQQAHGHPQPIPQKKKSPPIRLHGGCLAWEVIKQHRDPSPIRPPKKLKVPKFAEKNKSK